MDFELVYNTYYKQVFSYVMAMVKDRNQAEEITQETFTRAISKGTYRNESSELTWLCSIAKNFYFDEIKKKKHIAELPDETEIASDCDLESTAIDKDSSYRLHVILHHLEEPYKEVFQLRVFGELSFEKIGTIFSKSENWARVTYHRAKLKIQERIDSDE